MKTFVVVGTRPNFVKLAPMYKALKAEGIDPIIVNTGQHYDFNMAGSFFKDLDIPEPTHKLSGTSNRTHAEMTASIMVEFERLCRVERPGLIILVGDVNSTVACALAASKLTNRPNIAHFEAGLRSYDRTMPEEINRVITDSLSDILFVHDRETAENLTREGLGDRHIEVVGPTQIDTIEMYWNKINSYKGVPLFTYGLVTIHRPSNVDSETRLTEIIEKIVDLTEDYEIIFPVHPRTLSAMGDMLDPLLYAKLSEKAYVTTPMRYIEFMAMVKSAKFIITDSGGLQEEAAYFNTKTFTLRTSTERPKTCTHGSNTLCDIRQITTGAIDSENTRKLYKQPLYDGKTCQRVARTLKWVLNTRYL